MSHLALRDPQSVLVELLISQLLHLFFLPYLASKTLQPPLLSMCQSRWAPPRLKVLLLVLVLEVAATGLMIVSQHKLLRNIDQFLHDHRSLLCILSFAFSIFNLHNLCWSLLRINLHRHWFVLLLFETIFLAHWMNWGRPLL